MFYSDDHKLIFVHIQRCGGNSVRRALRDVLRGTGRSHHTVAEILDIVGPEKFMEYEKFAFVRNPWDKMLSHWRYARRVKIWRFRRFRRPSRPAEVIRGKTDFATFIRQAASNGMAEYNQSDRLTMGDELMVDHVGRYENMAADFARICMAVGLKSRQLPRVNASGPPERYQGHYTKQTRRLVARHLAEDIERFGYSFSEAA